MPCTTTCGIPAAAICASPFVGNGTGIVRVGLNKIRDKMAPERRIEVGVLWIRTVVHRVLIAFEGTVHSNTVTC